MKEELIQFKTALLAKEKGFNIKCNFIYFLPHPDIAKREGVEENTWIEIPNCSNLINGIQRPSQSLLQRWLRETHNIHIIVEPWKGLEGEYNFDIGYNYEALSLTIFEGKLVRDVICSSGAVTYESTLEFALFEGLTLIK